MKRGTQQDCCTKMPLILRSKYPLLIQQTTTILALVEFAVTAQSLQTPKLQPAIHVLVPEKIITQIRQSPRCHSQSPYHLSSSLLQNQNFTFIIFPNSTHFKKFILFELLEDHPISLRFVFVPTLFSVSKSAPFLHFRF